MRRRAGGWAENATTTCPSYHTDITLLQPDTPSLHAMAARKRLKKKAVEVVQTVPLRHRFPEDDDPSPYHDGRDPDAADEDSDDEEEPTWADYKETFYEGPSPSRKTVAYGLGRD